MGCFQKLGEITLLELTTMNASFKVLLLSVCVKMHTQPQ